MEDDIDRECCASVERIFKHGLRAHTVTRVTDSGVLDGQPHGWSLQERIFHDPGMTLVLEHPGRFGANIYVTVKISWNRQ